MKDVTKVTRMTKCERDVQDEHGDTDDRHWGCGDGKSGEVGADRSGGVIDDARSKVRQDVAQVAGYPIANDVPVLQDVEQ